MRYEGHLLVFIISIWIFLERRTDEAGLSSTPVREGLGVGLHQYFDEFGSTIARHDIGFTDAKALAGNQRVDLHAGRVFRQQCVEIGPQFVLHPATGEVGIYQIAEVQQLWESPETAIPSVIFAQHVLLVGKQCLGNVQILLVINLVPFLLTNGQGFHVVIVEQRNDAQHVLVVLVVAHSLGVGIKEGHVFLL